MPMRVAGIGQGLAQAMEKLDGLTWGFRISKMQEWGIEAKWVVLYVNPANGVWYSAQSDSLITALKDAISGLEEE